MTPCYNEEPGIADCYRRVREIMETRLPSYDYEHIFIDNCSIDLTVDVLKSIAAADRRVKIIVNSRNFGAARSSFHGLLETQGHATPQLTRPKNQATGSRKLDDIRLFGLYPFGPLLLHDLLRQGSRDREQHGNSVVRCRIVAIAHIGHRDGGLNKLWK